MMNIIAIVIAYLLGSLSGSILLSKLLKFPDPRKEGSGNAGATNVLRTVGRHQALGVLVIDALKGLVAIWIARLLGVQGAYLAFAGLAAVIGHVFPIFFKFKGGKGVATGLGVLLGLSVVVGVVCAVVWAVVAFVSRFASLASLIAAACAPILMLIFSNPYYTFPMILMALLIIWKHWANIQRLRDGSESKIKFSS